MSGAVAFGLCALSFAAGCVVTAVMLRREQPPPLAPEVEPPPSPVVAVEPPAEARWPPEDYVGKPIHRNPVMGLPTALPAPEPTRPVLVLVPGLEPGEPVEPTRVRRMRVVPDPPEPPNEPEPPVLALAEPDPDAPDRSADAGAPAHPGPVTGPEPPAPTAEPPLAEPPPSSFPLPDATEFRRRYLRTFEAARRGPDQ